MKLKTKIKKDNTLGDMIAHPAKIVKYFDFDEKRVIICPVCGWSGLPDGHKGYYNELFDISCPKCDKMLYVVSYPTRQETEEAAVAGNQAAKDHLVTFSVRDKILQNFEAKKLKSPDELPNLEGSKLDFIFEVEDKPENKFDEHALIICDHKIIWAEPLLYECWSRFNEIREVLIKKYGEKFNSFKPTQRAEFDLYGDDLGAPNKIILD